MRPVGFALCVVVVIQAAAVVSIQRGSTLSSCSRCSIAALRFQHKGDRAGVGTGAVAGARISSKSSQHTEVSKMCREFAGGR